MYNKKKDEEDDTKFVFVLKGNNLKDFSGFLCDWHLAFPWTMAETDLVNSLYNPRMEGWRGTFSCTNLSAFLIVIPRLPEFEKISFFFLQKNSYSNVRGHFCTKKEEFFSNSGVVVELLLKMRLVVAHFPNEW